MGTPTPPISAALSKCHSAVGKAWSKVIATTFKVRTKCQTEFDKSAGALDFSCATADPDGKIVAALDKAHGIIDRACASPPRLQSLLSEAGTGERIAR